MSHLTRRKEKFSVALAADSNSKSKKFKADALTFRNLLWKEKTGANKQYPKKTNFPLDTKLISQIFV